MERDVGVLRRVSVVVMLTLSFYKSERSMLSHFVGSPLTNCAAERKPLSTDGNAMKEAERERASKEKWYVTRMAARRRNGGGRSSVV